MGVKRSELFDDESDQDDVGADQAQLQVNEEFAKRFEYNKKRAELHRLQEKHPEVAARIQARGLDGNDDDNESTTSEEEDEGQLNAETEHEWAQALLKIRKKDPSIYDAATRLFQRDSPSDSSGDADAAEKATGDKPKKSKKTLRAILYDQAIADAEGQGDDVDTDVDRKRRLRAERSAALAYDPEQRALRDALVSRMNAGDSDADGSGGEGGGLGGLTVRQRAAPDNATATELAGEVPEAAAAADLDRYFAAQDDLPGNDAHFLRDYFRRRLWTEEGDDAGESTGAVLRAGPAGGLAGPMADVEEDEDFLDRADQFEYQYNFRSEEPGGADIRTYPRQIEGLARQEDSRRKRQRESKRVRQEEREEQRASEVKRLKNLKKQEVGDALSQLAAVSGRGAPGKGLLKQLMDNDFDPDAWDKQMADAFGDDYYAEAEPEMDVVAAADEAMREAEGWRGEAAAAGDGGIPGSDEDGDASGEEDGQTRTFAAVHKKLTGKSAGLLPDTDYGGGPGEEGDEDSEGEDDVAGQRAEELADSRNKIHALLQEYYNLDHEDEVGGVKTRFRYRQVEPINDGLSAEEILALPDRDLNAIVGLRKLAPYHDDTHRIRPNYKALNEAREKLIAQGLVVPKAKGGDRSSQRSGKSRDGKKYKLGDASAAGGDAAGKVRDAWKGKGGVSTGRVVKKGRAGAVAGVADEGKKGKRPGPRLRKALKEAAAAEASAADASAAVEEVGGAGKQVQAGGQTGAVADEEKGSRKQKPGKVRQKAVQDMSEEEKKAARLASYSSVLPGSGAFSGQGSAGVKSHKGRDAVTDTQGSGPEQSGPAGETEFSGLTKAAKKNMKRKLKRKMGVQTSVKVE